MKIFIIIPTYNEEKYIAQTLDSLLDQSYLPEQIIVVNDNSTDSTLSIVKSYTAKHDCVNVITSNSQATNLPGSKIIKAFYLGFNSVPSKGYDIICKFDADLIFPNNYLETIVSRFRESENLKTKDNKVGMVSGHLYIKKHDSWVYENIANQRSTRGPIKAYRKECFEQIGGLKPSIGWDTVDEMLARYYGWEVVTIPELQVKHLKPTGASYSAKSKYLQGEGLYKMRYGWWLTTITAAKMAWNKKKCSLIFDYLKGYFMAKKRHLKPLVTKKQGRFIRNYRWNGIKSRLGFKN